MSKASLAVAHARVDRIDVWCTRTPMNRQKKAAKGAVAGIRDWLKWLQEIVDTGQFDVAFEKGVNEKSPKFHNMEAIISRGGQSVRLPGFLQYTTGDSFGTLRDLRATAQSWCARVAGTTTTPFMPGFEPDPAKSRETSDYIEFPAAFDIANARTWPGFQTIHSVFLPWSSNQAWGQDGDVVGMHILYAWVQVVNTLLASTAGQTADLEVLHDCPDGGDLESIPSEGGPPSADDVGGQSDGEEAPEDEVEVVEMPQPKGSTKWAPVDYRPGEKTRDYDIHVPSLLALATSVTSFPHPIAARQVRHPLTPPADTAYRHNVALFRHAMSGIYADPIKETSEAYRQRLLDYGIEGQTYRDLREDQFKDTSSNDVLVHPKWCSRGSKFPPRSAETRAVRNVIVAVEAAMIVAMANGEAQLPPEGAPILLLYLADAAGRKIFRIKVSMGAILVGAMTSLAAIKALVPFWMHGGPFAAIHHHAIMKSDLVGGQLERLSRARLFGKWPVQLRALTDLAEAAVLYSPPSLYSVGNLNWLCTKRQGYAFCLRATCPCCTLTGMEIFTLVPPGTPDAIEVAQRAVPPTVRGRDSIELPHWWGGVHAVNRAMASHCATVAVDFPPEASEARDLFTGFFPGLGWNVYRDPGRAQKLQAQTERLQKRRQRGSAAAMEEEGADEAAEADDQAEQEARDVGGAHGGAKKWVSRAVPSETRAKDAKVLLSDADKLRRAGEHCDSRPPIIDPSNPAGDGLPLAVHWAEGIAICQARRWPSRYIKSRPDARKWQARGRRHFRWMKCLAARTHPWQADKELVGVPWFEALDATAKAAVMTAAKRIYFDQQASGVSMGSHVVFEHGFDYLLDEQVPFDQAIRAVEEAGDHFFSYLYYTVPAMSPADGAYTVAGSLRTVWQTALEAMSCGVPRQTGRLAARIETNRAYV